MKEKKSKSGAEKQVRKDDQLSSNKKNGRKSSVVIESKNKCLSKILYPHLLLAEFFGVNFALQVTKYKRLQS